VNLSRGKLFILAALPLLILSTGCSERDPSGLDVARARIDPLVFDDDYGVDVYFQAFSGTDIYAASIDSLYAYGSARSFKVTVPPEGSALGAYAGGVLTSSAVRDHADFNALTFYARSSVNSSLNVAGFGNDNTGTSLYEAGRVDIPLTDEWTFVVIPIPSPSRLIAERGQFTVAEGWEYAHPLGHELWFDEIRFAELDNISNPRPYMPSVNLQAFVGTNVKLDGISTTFDVDGADVEVVHSSSYFDYQFTDPSVATVERGLIKAVGVGETAIAASLDGIAVEGSDTLTAYLPPSGPADAPTLPASDVISMFSDVYQDVLVDTWNPHWGGTTTQVADYSIDGDNMKMYSFLNWVGIMFTSQKIDASEMTHLHLDVFAPEGTNFRVKVVAFGSADDGNSDHEPQLQFDAYSTPAFVAGEWSSLEIPLADFNLAVSWEFIGIIVLSTDDAELVLVDNLYWHK